MASILSIQPSLTEGDVTEEALSVKSFRNLFFTSQNLFCVACDESWRSLRICYPHSAEANHEEGFEHLGDVGAYSACFMKLGLTSVGVAGLKRKVYK